MGVRWKRYLRTPYRKLRSTGVLDLPTWFKSYEAKSEALLHRVNNADLVVHVGAHLGQEADAYETLGARCVVWCEADPTLFRRLKTRLTMRRLLIRSSCRHKAILAAVSNGETPFVQLHRFSNDGASNSIHAPTDVMKSRWPSLVENEKMVSVGTLTLNEVLHKTGASPENFRRPLLVLDVQGHELEVLKGLSPDLLQHFNSVIVEVSTEPLFDGGASYDALCTILGDHQFVCVSERPDYHGDVLFVSSTSLHANP